MNNDKQLLKLQNIHEFTGKRVSRSSWTLHSAFGS
jgi:hypothetical protein